MKSPPSSENDERDQEMIKLLQGLGSFKSKYPPELFAARRAAFVAQIERLKKVKVEEGLDPGEEEIVRFVGNLKSVKAEYPSDLLAARRSAFLQQVEKAGTIRPLDRIWFSLKSLFQSKLRVPAVPWANLSRTSLVLAVLMITALIGSLLFSRAAQGVPEPTQLIPTDTYERGTIICSPGDQTTSCSSRELDPSQDLADQGNGVARPAVAKDAQSSDGAVYPAAYVNDGRSATSWVSNSAHSWIKIDLGRVRTFNTVTVQKSSAGSSYDNNPGQFVIAVAQSDIYSDGNYSNDYTEYAQVFNSEQTGFSGAVSQGATVRTFFPVVKARFVKLTFENAGAAIEEVRVFMAQPPELAGHPTRTRADGVTEGGTTVISTNTSLPMDTPVSEETRTQLPADTALPTDTLLPTLTDTPYPGETPIPLPINTLPPVDTATPLPVDPLPLDTPIPLPTDIPPAVIPSTLQSLPESTDPIIVTGNNQNLTFTCNGNAVDVRGTSNTVTLFGSCSSITVNGNRNQIFWQFGSPVITNKGKDNIISQMS